jgi:uncharacterized cysteine cluster protein YcgN (CxxCxxCC family)
MLYCTWLTEENTCKNYEKRLNMCKNFPNVKYGSLGKLPPGCGYRMVPLNNFSDVLKNSESKKFNLLSGLLNRLLSYFYYNRQ